MTITSSPELAAFGHALAPVVRGRGRRSVMRWLPGVVGLVLIGCVATDPAEPLVCAYEVHGACIAVGDGVTVERAHVERQVEMAEAYWQVAPDLLAGWTIEYVAGELRCNGELAAGCTHFADEPRTVRVQALDPSCAETAQLIHELGHVIHGDAGHRGAYWDYELEQRASCLIVREPGASPGCDACGYYTDCS